MQLNWIRIPLTGLTRHMFVPVPSKDMDYDRHVWLENYGLGIHIKQQSITQINTCPCILNK